MIRVWYNPKGKEPAYPWLWVKSERSARNWILAGAEVIALPKDAEDLRLLAKEHKVKVVEVA